MFGKLVICLSSYRREGLLKIVNPLKTYNNNLNKAAILGFSGVNVNPYRLLQLNNIHLPYEFEKSLTAIRRQDK